MKLDQLIGGGIGIALILLIIFLMQLPSQIRYHRERKRIAAEFDALWEQHTRELIRQSQEINDKYDPEKIHERRNHET